MQRIPDDRRHVALCRQGPREPALRSRRPIVGGLCGRDVTVLLAAVVLGAPFGCGGSATLEPPPDASPVDSSAPDGPAREASASDGSAPDVGLPPACATSLLLPATSFPVGYQPNDVAVADVNGDALPDLLVVNTGTDPSGVLASESVSVLLGDGKGGFSPQSVYVASGPDEQPRSLAVGDLDGDGDVDLAVADSQGFGVSVMLNQGRGVFGAAAEYWAGWNPWRAYVADFDGDHRLDILSLNSSDDSFFNQPTDDVSLLRGAGDGTFGTLASSPDPSHRPPRYAVGNDPREAAIADFDGDGVLDVAVANWQDGSISVLLGRPGAAFAPAVTVPTGVASNAVVAVDVDGDGAQDLAVVGEKQGTQGMTTVGTGFVALLRNQGKGTFGAAVLLPITTGSFRVRSADINADGVPDLVVGNGLFGSPPPGSIDVLLGRGDGTFGAPLSYAVDDPAAVALADVNGDGRIDVVVANNGTATVSVLLNGCAAGGGNR